VQSLFPEELLAQEGVRRGFNYALDMMNQALGGHVPPPQVRRNLPERSRQREGGTIASCGERHPLGLYYMGCSGSAPRWVFPDDARPCVRPPLTRVCVSRLQAPPPVPNLPAPSVTPRPGAAPLRPAEMSFKELVEAFAAQHDVAFVPKAGRTHEGLQVRPNGHRLPAAVPRRAAGR
jgi:hypothetical protein